MSGFEGAARPTFWSISSVCVAVSLCQVDLHSVSYAVPVRGFVSGIDIVSACLSKSVSVDSVPEPVHGVQQAPLRAYGLHQVPYGFGTINAAACAASRSTTRHFGVVG